MPIIDTPAGTLEVTNAILSASEFRATQKISVSNSAPTKNFSVGTRFHVDKDSVDPVSVTGNVVASGIKISNLTISPAFDFASVSNVGNVTANVIQFANATTSFVASSNVEIGGNITLTSNAQVKVGSNVLAEYTGPHGREPKEVPLKKYPEIAFSIDKFEHDVTTNTFTQAGYTVTSSSNYGTNSPDSSHTAWRSFTNIIDGNGYGWVSGSGADGHTLAYTTGSANATQYLTNIDTATSTDNVSSRNGAWLKLELPKKIILSRVDFFDRYDSTTSTTHERVVEAFVYGGNSNSGPWYELGKQSDAKNVAQYTDDNPASLTIDTSTYYKYYIIQPTLLTRGLTYASYGQIKYYGYEEPAPPGDLSLDTTLKSTFNSVRSNNYVMYFDGKDPDTGNVPKYLPSGSVKSITPHNAVFDTTNNCWTLDGSTESNVTTGSLGFEGDVPHTVSTWFNASNLEANALTQQLFSIGTGSGDSIKKLYIDTEQISTNTWNNLTYAYEGNGGSKVTYLNGRKIVDETITNTFGRYPSVPLNSYTTTVSGKGQYKVSASSVYENNNEGYEAWEAFNRNQAHNGDGWISASHGYYNGSGNNTYTGPSQLASNTLAGDWLKIEMPYKIFAQTVFMYHPANTERPKVWKVYGSNDDLNWTEILSRTSVVDNTTTAHAMVPVDDISTAYRYFALVVNATNGLSNYTAVSELTFYGHKEGDLTRFPEPTKELKYPHLPLSNYGCRGYVVSVSSQFMGYNGWEAFDENNPKGGNTGAGSGWACHITTGSGNAYDTTSGAEAQAVTHHSGSAQGEWIQLELPRAITLNKFQLESRAETSYIDNMTGFPKDVILYGSVNGSSWSVVKDFTTVSKTGGDVHIENIGSSTAYKYYALVIESIHVSGTDVRFTSIGQIRLYGTEDYSEGVPIIVGGPFAGKVANFRVYDQYLGDERIQEIYDAQKDEFGHKKSSMTFYKGRVGVGTTEPEGALTVIDEPHALQKFPISNVTTNTTVLEDQGCLKLTTADQTDIYKAFDGLTSTTWDSTVTHTQSLSPEVDPGAWFKIETEHPMSLKKAEITSFPYWRDVGEHVTGDSTNFSTGVAVACSHDGTRFVVSAPKWNNDYKGLVRVYTWSPRTGTGEIRDIPSTLGGYWRKTGADIEGTQASERLGHAVAMSGNGQYIALASTFRDESGTDKGRYAVYEFSGDNWVPFGQNVNGLNTSGYFVGDNASDYAGWSIKLSYDGKTVAAGYPGYNSDGTDKGVVRVHTYSNNGWTVKGSEIVGDTNNDMFGLALDMSEDGKFLAIGGDDANPSKVKVYEFVNSNWVQKGSNVTYTGAAGSGFGHAVALSNDGNVLAIGIRNADTADGALEDDRGIVRMYHWNASTTAWDLNTTIYYPVNLESNDDDDFGTTVNLSGDGKRLIVSSPWSDPENPGGTPAGTAGVLWVYEYTGYQWVGRKPDARLNGVGFGLPGRSGHDEQGQNVIGYLGADDSAVGSGIENDYWLNLGFNDMGGTSVAISRDGSTIVAGEWAWNPYQTSGDTGRARVFQMASNIKSIWGSNDNINWTKIVGPTREDSPFGVAGKAFRSNDYVEFKNIDNSNYYKYHAVVCDAFTRLQDVKLYGTKKQEASKLHDGKLTLTKNITVPHLDTTGLINMKGDYTEVKANSKVVTEYKQSKRIYKYPRIKLTATSQTDAGQEGYKVSTSYEHPSYPGWHAFNNDKMGADNGTTSARVGWHTGGSTLTGYNGAGAEDGGFAHSGSRATYLGYGTERGEWIQLELPVPIALKNYIYYPQGVPGGWGNVIGSGVLYARRRIGDSWREIHRWGYTSSGHIYRAAASGAAPPSQDNKYNPFYSWDINPSCANEYYKYFALVATHRANAGGPTYGISVNELELYGVPEYDDEIDNMSMVLKSTPIVPKKDGLVLYWDAEHSIISRGHGGDLNGTNTYGGQVDDLSGNNRHGTINCRVDNGEIKSFRFDGTYTSNVQIDPHGLFTSDGTTVHPDTTNGGQISFSLAFWFKRVRVMNATGYDYVLVLGNTGTNGESILAWMYDDRLSFDCWGSSWGFWDIIQLDKWYHIVVGHDTGFAVSNGDFAYMNGKRANYYPLSSTPQTQNLHGTRLTLGGDHDGSYSELNGNIANFRLYNRALREEDVCELYNYQKEYFKHGTLGVTLKNGQLGVGTEDPCTTLDVRGDIRGGCPVFFSCTASVATGVGSAMNWDRVHINKGNGICRDLFTAPLEGYYHLDVQAYNSSGGYNTVALKWMLNGEDDGVSAFATADSAMYARHDGLKHISGSLIVYMRRGDYIQVLNSSQAGVNIAASHNRFNGFYLSS
jgi:hypothetical protein